MFLRGTPLPQITVYFQQGEHGLHPSVLTSHCSFIQKDCALHSQHTNFGPTASLVTVWMMKGQQHGVRAAHGHGRWQQLTLLLLKWAD